MKGVKVMIKRRRNRTIRKADDGGSFPTGIQKKYIMSSVLKALALEVVIVAGLSRPSYIQGLVETMQHMYADQSVHR